MSENIKNPAAESAQNAAGAAEGVLLAPDERVERDRDIAPHRFTYLFCSSLVQYLHGLNAETVARLLPRRDARESGAARSEPYVARLAREIGSERIFQKIFLLCHILWSVFEGDTKVCKIFREKPKKVLANSGILLYNIKTRVRQSAGVLNGGGG